MARDGSVGMRGCGLDCRCSNLGEGNKCFCVQIGQPRLDNEYRELFPV
jgi:hypothetical protein